MSPEPEESLADFVRRGLLREATAAGEDSSPAARVRALELLGRTEGMFADVRPQAEGEVRLRVTQTKRPRKPRARKGRVVRIEAREVKALPPAPENGGN